MRIQAVWGDCHDHQSVSGKRIASENSHLDGIYIRVRYIEGVSATRECGRMEGGRQNPERVVPIVLHPTLFEVARSPTKD